MTDIAFTTLNQSEQKIAGSKCGESVKGTLGCLLYADSAKSRVSENSWVAFVRSIAMGDQRALHELYERTHRIVFTLIMRAGDSRDLTTGVLRPEESLWLWVCLAHRTAKEGGGGPLLPATRQMSEPEWEEVAAGISCKLLSSDTGQQRASMLARLAPGVDYPPHTHATRDAIH